MGEQVQQVEVGQSLALEEELALTEGAVEVAEEQREGEVEAVELAAEQQSSAEHLFHPTDLHTHAIESND